MKKCQALFKRKIKKFFGGFWIFSDARDFSLGTACYIVISQALRHTVLGFLFFSLSFFFFLTPQSFLGLPAERMGGH